jgi:hypothetical protein
MAVRELGQWPDSAQGGKRRVREQRAAGKGEATRAAVKELGFRAKSEEKGKFLFFFFLFKYYKAFSNDFES